MDWSLVLKIAASVTAVTGVAALLGSLYLWYASQRGDRSLREIIAGERIVHPEQVLDILRTFTSDDDRLRALRSILSYDTQTLERLLDKVKDRVDVKGLSLKMQKAWTARLVMVGVLLLGFAITAHLAPAAAPRNAPSVTKPFDTTLSRLPLDQRNSALRFLPQRAWDHDVTARAELVQPDTSAFEVLSTSVSFDLTLWRSFVAGDTSLVSPVFVEKDLLLRKRQAADAFRLVFGTEGAALVAGCTSKQPYDVEIGPSSGVPRTNLVTEAHLVVDVRRYAIGDTVRVSARAIMWNGVLADDPWLCLVAYGGGGRGRLLLQAPQELKFWNVGYFKYPDGQKTAVSATGEGDQLVDVGGKRVLWELEPLLGGCVYEVQWRFEPGN